MQIDKSERKYWFALLLIAAAFTFIQGLDLYKDIKAASWPKLTGTLFWHVYPTAPPDIYFGPVIEPFRTREFHYYYKVAGQQYSSNNKSFGLTLSDKIDVVRPDGRGNASVQIYVNPRDPSEAVLLSGPKIINICFLALGAIWMFWLIKLLTSAGHPKAYRTDRR